MVNQDNITGKQIGYFIGLVILIIFLLNTFYTVSAGERAVLLTFGKPSLIARGEGLHIKIPFIQTRVIMDVKTQKYEAPLTAASKDLQDVNTKIAINYRIVPDKVPEIYRDIGINYADTIIYPLEQETNKGITAQFTAEELITKRELVRERMKSSLIEKLQSRNIIVEEISIIDFKFSPSFTQAIEAKVTAEQNALAAKNKLEQIKYEAEQAIAAAEGKAKAIQVEGDALRNNPQVTQLRAIEKWNGIMPQVTGSTTPFFDVTGIIKP